MLLAVLNHSHNIVIRNGKIAWKHGSNLPSLKPILLYRGSKCKQIKKKCSDNSLWTVYELFIFLPFYKIIVSFFFLSRCKQNKIKPCQNWFQFVKETQTNTVEGQTTQISYNLSYRSQVAKLIRQKKCIIPSSRNFSVTKKSRVSTCRKYKHKGICINTQLTTFYTIIINATNSI